MGEQSQRFDASKDFVVAFPCGCRVRWLARWQHRNMQTAFCTSHEDYVREKDKIVDAAKGQFRAAGGKVD